MNELNKPGVKDDEGKVEPSFVFEYFSKALEAVARVSMFGARKYTRGGWRTVPNGIQRYTDAMDRHRLREGYELYDFSDSDLLHAAQVAWNALARLELMLQEGIEICARVPSDQQRDQIPSALSRSPLSVVEREAIRRGHSSVLAVQQRDPNAR